ncbi:MAG: hypothetical protein ACO3SH_06475 [Candidatus Puniceispirillaceae bacterium]
MKQIKIGETAHPLFFSMVAIERIMAEHNIQDFDQLAQNNGQGLANTLAFARSCAWHGIRGGYKKINERMPWQHPDDLAEEFTRLAELTPALEGFTNAVQAFFMQPDEETSEAAQGN